MVKNLPANAGDTGLNPGSGRFPGVGNGNPFQYTCLKNSMDRGGLLATAHGVTKESDTHAGTVNHGRGTGTSDRDLPASGSQNK